VLFNDHFCWNVLTLNAHVLVELYGGAKKEVFEVLLTP